MESGGVEALLAGERRAEQCRAGEEPPQRLHRRAVGLKSARPSFLLTCLSHCSEHIAPKCQVYTFTV